jgi:hypothetical protein
LMFFSSLPRLKTWLKYAKLYYYPLFYMGMKRQACPIFLASEVL